MRLKFLVPALICLATAACSGGSPTIELHTGEWRAWLDSPGGELPFGVEFTRGDDGLRAFILNGIERLPVDRVAIEGSLVTLAFDHFDSAITAELTEDGTRLDGRWEKTGRAGARTRLEFHAVAGARPRFGDVETASGAKTASNLDGLAGIDGRWIVRFAESDEPAVGIFEADDDGIVHGTFMTTTGDYRYLAGSFDGRRLRLSCFDGAHAFLFDARLQTDGGLTGDFWSRDTWHETWTARRDDDASLPDAFTLTRWVGGDLNDLSYPDLDGRVRSLADPEFAGGARIIEVFGTWCPNCNDATRYLVELHRTYRDRGLSVLGLAFELSGDFERDAEQVRVYAAHHGIEYPMLVAGVSDKAKASRAFPLVDRIRSFPTTIFLHADGRVRAVHQGYSGPATGAANVEVRERFRLLIEELLAEAVAADGATPG